MKNTASSEGYALESPGTGTRGQCKNLQVMHLVRLVVLGAPGVGKTTLIENFLSNCVLSLKPPLPAPSLLSSTIEESKQQQDSTHSSHSYFFSILLNEHVLQVRVIDVPAISFFPSSSLLEWTDFEGTSLRSADGYLLVFDLTSPGE